MKIPFYRPSITQAEIDEVVQCLQSGWLTTGPRTRQFETEFSNYVRQKHSVALNSCTAALHLGLEAIGLKEGDTVVVPTMTFAASAEVVRYFNAHPLLVDCRTEDFGIDVQDARRRILAALDQGRKVTAIIPVHYGGQVADMTGIQVLAREFDLKIIEDAAHCCPAYYAGNASSGTEDENRETEVGRDGKSYGGRTLNSQPSTINSPKWLSVGAEADITCFSFYANKCITTGEGGMACTRSDEYAERMRVMSLHGISKDAWKRFTAEGSWYYEIIAPGFKYNLTDIASALGLHQIRRADELHRKRKAVAELYSEYLKDLEEIRLPIELTGRIHSWHLYAIRLDTDRLTIDRAQIIQELKALEIGTSVHWLPLHMHPYYRDKYGYAAQDLPVAAGLYPQLITLPLYPDMTESEVRYVCDSLRQVVADHLKPAVTSPVSR